MVLRDLRRRRRRRIAVEEIRIARQARVDGEVVRAVRS
jgi:hypothetical protein